MIKIRYKNSTFSLLITNYLSSIFHHNIFINIMLIVCKKDTCRNLPLKKRDSYGIHAMNRLNLNAVKYQFQVLTAAISTT
jgi:hypothetical protein